MAKILVVEDDRVSRLIIVNSVNKQGHVTIQASDGQRAWTILEDNPDIDLIITDMMMPYLNGQELLARIRESSQYSAAPVIVISGVIGPKAISKVLKEGAGAFLPKPISTLELQEYVGRFLSGSYR